MDPLTQMDSRQVSRRRQELLERYREFQIRKIIWT